MRRRRRTRKKEEKGEGGGRREEEEGRTGRRRKLGHRPEATCGGAWLSNEPGPLRTTQAEEEKEKRREATFYLLHSTFGPLKVQIK